MQRHDEDVMSPERWERLQEIYYAALPMNQRDRRAYLNQACAGDEELRRGAASLLTADDEMADDFLQGSAFVLGLKVLADEETGRTEMALLTIGMPLDGRYEILEKLAEGGMGEVYQAQDQRLNCLVAVKVLKEEWLKHEWVVTRFKQEATVLAKIDHPGVVGILDAGALEGGQPYLVMKYVEGPDLSQRIDEVKGGMDFAEVTEIIKQVGRAVTVAHQKGVIHRDLKPGNIMLHYDTSSDLQVKVMDFGIAQVKDSASRLMPATRFAVGTPPYMSPEQRNWQELTPASDVYSLGLIAYEMLTRPFHTRSAEELRELQKNGVKEKPSALRPGLPEAADEVILKALACDAGQRYQSARDFSDELARALTSTLPLSPPPSPLPSPPTPQLPQPLVTNKRRLIVAVAVVLVAAIVGGVLWWNLSGRTLPPRHVVATDAPKSSETDKNHILPPGPAVATDTPMSTETSNSHTLPPDIVVIVRPQGSGNKPLPAVSPVYVAEPSFPTEPPPQGMVYVTIGFTVWRTRLATTRDSSDTAKETIDRKEMVSERIADSISDGDRIYLGIESLTGEFLPDRGGFLYVINREQYADGTFGRARLIFPTLLTYGGNNRAKPGQPIVLPRPKGEPFIVNRSRSRSDHIAETYTIILSPREFQLPKPLSDEAIVLPDNWVADWDKQYGGRMSQATLRGGVGQTRTKREQAVGSRDTVDTAKPLTRDEPLPQICYRGAVRIGDPAMVTVALRFKD